MTDKNKLFRKSLVENITSPDALDRKISVVSIKGWIAALVSAVFIATTLVWSCVSEISTSITADGIMMYGSGIKNIVAAQSGIISDISLSTGDTVYANNVVARIRQDELTSQINALKENRDSLENFISSENFDTSLLTSELYFEFYDIICDFENAQTPELQTKAYDKMYTLASTKLSEYNKQLSLLKLQLEKSGSVFSDSQGTVLEVYCSAGEYVETGDVLMSVIISDMDNVQKDSVYNRNRVLFYVPLSDGKKISPNMEVYVNPSTVDKSEAGYIIGRVRSISDYAVSREAMLNSLNNEQLVDSIATDQAMLEVTVELLINNDIQSGSENASIYQWTTKEGSSITVEPGTVCTGKIKISTQRPIEYIFPFTKKWFEGDN